MKLKYAYVLLAVVILITSGVLAQDDVPVDPGAEPAYVTINLEAGFVLDPFVVSVNGGGDVDVSVLGGDCVGFVNLNPTVKLEWTGEADFIEAFFFTDHDPVLVIQTPDGEFHCNDDANSLVLDPVIQIDNPQPGRYAVWVGSYAPNQLIPGFLVLTGSPQVNIGTFDPGALVAREAIAEVLEEPEALDADVLLDESPAMDTVPLMTGDAEAVSVDLVAQGDIAAFDVDLGDVICAGFVSETPSYVFAVSESTDMVRTYFEAQQDTTIIVETPDGEFICNDDADGNGNLNPLVDIAEPVEGEYRVYLGTFDPAFAVEGSLTVTVSSDDMPDALQGESE